MGGTLHLDANCRLGEAAMAYVAKRSWNPKSVQYMRLSGDGCVCFGIREDLPYYTQKAHFTDEDGTKYDQWENKVSIHEILGVL